MKSMHNQIKLVALGAISPDRTGWQSLWENPQNSPVDKAFIFIILRKPKGCGGKENSSLVRLRRPGLISGRHLFTMRFVVPSRWIPTSSPGPAQSLTGGQDETRRGASAGGGLIYRLHLFSPGRHRIYSLFTGDLLLSWRYCTKKRHKKHLLSHVRSSCAFCFKWKRCCEPPGDRSPTIPLAAARNVQTRPYAITFVDTQVKCICQGEQVTLFNN